jgi:4-carboxymuconolactone decarboxylase
MKSQNYQQGIDLFVKLHGKHSGEAIVNNFAKLCPKMADITIETIFGDIMQDEILDLKIRELCFISSLTAVGNAVPQLRAHCEAALVVGASKQEIIAVIFQNCFTAGFPVAVNALISLQDLLSE